MSWLRFVALTCLIAATAVTPTSAQTQAQAQDPKPARKPNVVMIVADDLGYGELTCQGYSKDIPTPNIDTIARNGIRFTNGYVSCPVCSPTRAGLMTGRYQQRFGHEFNPGPANQTMPTFGFPSTETPLPVRIKKEGYATGMVGKWHLGFLEAYQPTNQGFDEFFGFLGGAHSYQNLARGIIRGKKPADERAYLTDAFTREAVAFIDRHQKEPFYLYLPFNAVHAPLEATAKYRKRVGSLKDEKRETFGAMLTALDDGVGAVLKKIRELGLEEDTLIVFHSDNGGPTQQTSSGNGPLNGHKAQVLEGGIRIPFMVQWKGHLPAGKLYDQPVITLDVAPTVLGAIGANTPSDARFDGVNLLPYLEGKLEGSPHESLYWRFGAQHAIRKGPWKLTKLANRPASLYNLADDIGETKDLSKEKPEIFQALQTAWKKWDGEMMKPRWQPGE